MQSWIELDHRRHAVTCGELRFEGTDWVLALTPPEGPAVELAGEADGDRLRVDLRSLDDLLAALQGHAITAYPGGQSICAAWLEVAAGPGGGFLLTAAFEFDWDRSIDPPGVTYAEPRRLQLQLVTG